MRVKVEHWVINYKQTEDSEPEVFDAAYSEEEMRTRVADCKIDKQPFKVWVDRFPVTT